MYAVHYDQAAVDACLSLCRGCYQRAIIMGSEALSGATLRGRAKNYSGRYARSAGRLIARCRAAGIAIEERIGDHNRRELHIGF